MTAPATTRRVLVVDDDPVMLRVASALLAAEGLEVARAASGEEAMSAVARGRFDLVLSDVKLPGVTGLELVRQVHALSAETPIILMTAFASVNSAVEAMRAGASDYIVKPFEPDDLKLRVRKALRFVRLENENRRLRQDLGTSAASARLIAASPAMRAVAATIAKLARTDLTVFLLGESGTGKEVMARALHYDGPRAEGPFVAVNCAALPRDLVESELFGSAKGAFTGAHRDRPGKFEAADGGTLFLDEAAELPLEAQPKLLRALEERAFERVGETTLRRVNVRVVAAANRDPRAMVEEGRFREDLYFRLAVAPVYVPPLRERPEDVGPLARAFLRRLASDEEAPELTAEAIAELERRRWPGNVRELKNVIERAFALNEGGPIEAEHLQDAAWGPLPSATAPEPAAAAGGTRLPADGAPLDDLVRDILLEALTRTSWNQSAAARLLRVPRHILQYRMAKYGIRQPPRP
jgi:two-component system NtrC family response regulator